MEEMGASGATPEVAADESKAPQMSLSVESLGDVERRLDVEIPWDEVNRRLDEAYRELKHGVSLKGFRKGKVPRKMLQQLFGKHVVKEVAQRLVQESIVQALKDSDLSPVSEPKVEDSGITDGEAFKYTATMQVVPAIEAKDYFDVEVKVRPAEVTDEAVEMALKMKQQELTAFQSVEGRNTEAGDVLLVDVMGKVGDEPVDHEQELVELGEDPREPVPGLAAALTGIPPEETEREVELEVPGEEGKPARKARLLVTIHQVRKKVVPEIDDELAKDTGEAETLEELKQVLRGKLLEEDREKALQEARDQLLDTIAAKNELPTVPALIDRHLDRRMQLQMALLGMSPDAPGMDTEALKERMRGDATEAVKKALLLGAIAKQEKVEAQEADIEKKLAEIAGTRGQNVARVRSEYEKEGLMDSLRERILEDKTLDLLMSKAKIIEGEKEEAGGESHGDSESEPEQTQPQSES